MMNPVGRRAYLQFNRTTGFSSRACSSTLYSDRRGGSSLLSQVQRRNYNRLSFGFSSGAFTFLSSPSRCFSTSEQTFPENNSSEAKLVQLARYKKNRKIREGTDLILDLLNDPDLFKSEKFFSSALSFCYNNQLEELFAKVCAVAEERGVSDFRLASQKLAFLVATEQTKGIEDFRQVLLSKPEDLGYREIYTIARSYQIENQEEKMIKFIEEELFKRLPGPYTEMNERKNFLRILELYVVTQNAQERYDSVVKLFHNLKNLEIPIFVGSIINTFSLAFFKLEKVEEGLELLDKASLEGLHGSRAVGNILRLLLHKAEYEKAWDVVEKKMMLTNLTPDPFTTSSLIALLLQRGEEERAWEMYNVVLPEPEYKRLAPVYLANFVNFYSVKRSFDGLERVLKEAQAANAALSMASFHHMLRTVLYSDRTDLAEKLFAAAEQSSVVRKQPITAQLPLLMAQFYHKQNNFPRLQKYLDMVSKSPSVLSKYEQRIYDQLKTVRLPISQKIKNLLIFEKGNGDSVSE